MYAAVSGSAARADSHAARPAASTEAMGNRRSMGASIVTVPSDSSARRSKLRLSFMSKVFHVVCVFETAAHRHLKFKPRKKLRKPRLDASVFFRAAALDA